MSDVPAMEGALFTAEEFASMPERDDAHDELGQGRVQVFPLPTLLHGSCCATLACLLGSANQRGRYGHAVLRTGIIIARNPDSVFAPDLAFWSHARLPTFRCRVADFLE